MNPRINKKPAKKERRRSEAFFLIMTVLLFLALAIFLFWYFGTI
jgi:hypothetical protein